MCSHLTSLVWVCVLWLPWKLNGIICAMPAATYLTDTKAAPWLLPVCGGAMTQFFSLALILDFSHTWKATSKWIFLWCTYECIVIPYIYIYIVGTLWHFDCYFTTVLNVCVSFGERGSQISVTDNPSLLCCLRCDKHWHEMCETPVKPPVNTGEHPPQATAPSQRSNFVNESITIDRDMTQPLEIDETVTSEPKDFISDL